MRGLMDRLVQNDLNVNDSYQNGNDYSQHFGPRSNCNAWFQDNHGEDHENQDLLFPERKFNTHFAQWRG